MTDEEMAEQYAIENWEYYEDGRTDYEALKQAFLAGLKAGRPEWHDLRKDPNDLPKRNNELTDRSDVVITDKGIAHYNFRKQKWYVHNFECDMSFSEDVIVWCEIPTFTDKE
jgi:hypothetical protein